MVPDSARLYPSLNSGNRHTVKRDVYAIPTSRFGIVAAGTYYLSTAGLFKPGMTNFGLAVQSTRALNLGLTLDCEDLVISEPTAAIWHPDIPITVNAITPLVDTNGNPLFANMIRVTATGPGVMIISSL